jgi:putative toxin-antitoxin system antitoxin component (TIGR02293 family)
MITDPTSVTTATAARLTSLAELWQYIDDAAPAPKKTSTARTGLVKVTTGVKFGKRTYAVAIDNERAYRILKRGISSKAIEPLASFLGLGKGNVAEYLDMDRVTANRRAQKNQPLPEHAAEGVLRLLELDRMAVDTFSTEEEAARWLRQPHPMLDGDTPLEAARNSFGNERVKEILVAIKYGGAV